MTEPPVTLNCRRLQTKCNLRFNFTQSNNRVLFVFCSNWNNNLWNRWQRCGYLQNEGDLPVYWIRDACDSFKYWMCEKELRTSSTSLQY